MWYGVAEAPSCAITRVSEVRYEVSNFFVWIHEDELSSEIREPLKETYEG